MSELSDEQRRQIEAEVAAKVAADVWRTIDTRLRALEGDEWAAGEEAEIQQVLEGPEQGRLVWHVGNRRLLVEEDELVVEMTLVDGRPTRRRVIGPEGVVRDDPIITPSLN